MPQLDDGARRATFQIKVEEGPQFSMGRLDFDGFPEKVVERLRSKWRIRTGEVFDAHIRRHFLEELRPVLRPASPSFEIHGDRKQGIGNVKFVVRQ